MIEFKGVSKAFGDNVVLRDISLAIPPGKTTAIVGPSGTGKSVALKHIVGLLRPDKGQVLCFGTDLATASERHQFDAPPPDQSWQRPLIATDVGIATLAGDGAWTNWRAGSERSTASFAAEQPGPISVSPDPILALGRKGAER